MKDEKSLKPYRRFKGFTDDWEQRKFEEIFEISQGLQIAISERFLEPGENRFFYITNEFLKSDYEGKYYVYNPSENVVCNRGDILMTRTGNTGIVVTDVEGCFHNNFFKIKYDKQYFDKYFICQFLSSPMMQKRILSSAGSSTIPDLSHKSFYKLDGFFPKIEEQKKISSFFINLDNLITLHQRKLDKYKDLKKAYLSKMFLAEGQRKPELRFKGFTDDWEQRKLADIVERVIRKNKNLESNLPLTISAQFGLIDQNDFFDKRIASKNLSGYYLLKKGEFAYNKSTSNDAPWGAIKRLDNYNNGALSTLYIAFKIKDNNLDSDFLAKYYDTDLWHKDIRKVAAEGARNHGLLNIAPEDFFDTTLLIPKNYREQKLIGTIIGYINNLITLYQRKLDKLKNIKKAYLNEMFV